MFCSKKILQSHFSVLFPRDLIKQELLVDMGGAHLIGEQSVMTGVMPEVRCPEGELVGKQGHWETPGIQNPTQHHFDLLEMSLIHELGHRQKDLMRDGIVGDPKDTRGNQKPGRMRHCSTRHYH
jgi:hypothetical protein